MEGMEQDKEGLICLEPKGRVIFSFASPYVFCGMPDPKYRTASVGGALFSGTFDLPEGTQARLVVEAANHAYAVTCGAKPKNEWVSMRVPSSKGV